LATVNIGNLTFTHRGDYDGSTAYAKNDVVYYSTNGNAYIAKQATTGNVPTNGTYWSQFAQGSGGIWNAGLSLGSANQILQVNSSANALEFTTKPEGKIVNMAYYENSTEYSNTNSSTYVTATNHSITYTPSASNNILFIEFMPNVRQNSGGSDVAFKYRIVRTPQGGSDTTFVEESSNQETYWYDSSGGQRLQFPRYFLHRDNTHNTTSQLTYRVDFRNPHSSQQVYMSNDGHPSKWRITEIKP
jgi:hypothetical protein